MKYGFLGVCVLGGTLLAGCGAQPGSSTVTYSSLSSDVAPLATADHAADFKLYPSDGTTPLYTASLDKGDQYGFVKDSEGKVVGFAKGNQIPLTAHLATSYVWKEQP